MGNRNRAAGLKCEYSSSKVFFTISNNPQSTLKHTHTQNFPNKLL